MLALGCLVPLVLMIGGALVGALIHGTAGSIWGSIIGLVAGLAVPAIMFGALLSARKKD